MAIYETDDASGSGSALCACCKFSRRQPKKNGKNDDLLRPTAISTTALSNTDPTRISAQTVYPLERSTPNLPRIVISEPRRQSAYSVNTARSEVYMTARTSRADEANQYVSMSELVQKIRSDAGCEDTPRQPPVRETIIEETEICITEMRIEGLPELHGNTRCPPTFISSIETESPVFSKEVSVSEYPPPLAVQQSYKPSINRRLGEITFNTYVAIWNAYTFMITTIALFFEKILPV
uniref:Uncharacterized protein n=1 Tax=Panagrellus redivivus TaxID=6233 RepID=A0A7E4VSR5_PANRE